MTTLDATDLFPELDRDHLAEYLERMSGTALPASPPTDAGIGPLTLSSHEESFPFHHLFEAIEDATHHPWTHGARRSDLLKAGRAARRSIVLDSLADTLTRPLITFLGEARDAGSLRAPTPHDRYREFTRRLAGDPSLIRSRFPVAWSAMSTSIRNTDSFLAELVSRLEQDWEAVTEGLGIPASDVVASLAPGGDCHHHGRRVTTVTTSSGARFVYKPRSVDGEWAYEQVVTRLASVIGPRPAAHVIRRCGYGYTEFVEAVVPDSLVSAAEQTGGLSALFYVLGCNDLHVENVLFTRDGPVPVDMETMLHPYVPGQDAASATAPDEANRLLTQSVFGTGVLPMVVSRPEDPDSYYDVGLLGQQREVNGGAFRHHAITSPFTDQMSVVLTKEKGEVGQDAEEPQSDLAEVRACSDAFAAAFEEAYRALLRSRQGLLSVVTECCAGLRLRFLHNPTQFYAQILSTLASPLPAASAAVARMLALRVGLTSPTHKEIITDEVTSLLDQDVPYFTTDTSRPVVLDAAGERVLYVLDQAPLDTALARIRSLSETDLGRQLRLIRSAFCAIVPDESIAVTNQPAPGPHRLETAAHTLSTTDLASDIASTLVERMLPDTSPHHPMTWIGPLASVETTRPWPPGVLGYDLYTGRLGTALALARAGRALDDRTLVTAASQIFDSTVELVNDDPEVTSPVRGTYTGAAGVAWALWAAGKVLERLDWCRSSGDILLRLWRSSRPTDPTGELDTIDGVITSWRVSQMIGVEDPVFSDDLDQALATVADGSWRSTEVARHSGFAHGTAGILYTVAHRPEAHRHIPVLLEHLDGFWDEASRNWFTASDRSRVNHGWCHGRVGVLLGLGAARLVQDHTVPGRPADLTELAADIVMDGASYNLTYCHGSLGDYDAARWLVDHGICSDPSVLPRMEEILTPEAISLKIHDPHSRYSLSDGLMVGIAGPLLHLAERIDSTIQVSPTTLEVRS